MARKPTVSLPDVFAKPGAAPARGTPIEALPQEDAPPPAEAVVAPCAKDAGSAPAPVEGMPDATSALSAPMVTTSASHPESTPAPSAEPASTVVVAPDAAPVPVVVATTGPNVGAATDTAPASTTTTTTTAPAAVMTTSATPTPPRESEATRPTPIAHGEAAPPPDGMAGLQRDKGGATIVPVAGAAPALKPTVTSPPSKPAEATEAAPTAQKVSPPAPDHGRARATEPAGPIPPSDGMAGAAHLVQDTSPAGPPERGVAWGIAIAALAVSLTTPFWYDGALRLLGVVPSLHRAQLEDVLTLSRQERKLRDVEQRLSSANTQLARTQGDLAQANRIQQEAAAWTRMVVLARLTEAMRSGRPFVSELAMARAANAIGGDLAPLAAVIAPYAPIGVPTVDDLGRDFRRLTDPVLRPARGLNPLAWASAALSYMPFGRGAIDPDPARAALREAAALVEAKRAFEAAAVLRPLTGPVREGMAGWLADVDARAAADGLDRRVEAALRPGRG